MDQVPGEAELIEHLIPEQTIPTGIILGITFIDVDGTSGYQYYVNTENLTFEMVGLLENLKLELLQAQWEEADDAD